MTTINSDGNGNMLATSTEVVSAAQPESTITWNKQKMRWSAGSEDVQYVPYSNKEIVDGPNQKSQEGIITEEMIVDMSNTILNKDLGGQVLYDDSQPMPTQVVCIPVACAPSPGPTRMPKRKVEKKIPYKELTAEECEAFI